MSYCDNIFMFSKCPIVTFVMFTNTITVSYYDNIFIFTNSVLLWQHFYVY